MNGFKNSGLWPVDRNVFTDADFAPSLVTHASHVAKPAIPKENPANSGYILVEEISPLPSNSAERTRPQSRKKRSASVEVLTGTPHKNSLNGTNIAGSLGAKPKSKGCLQQQKLLLITRKRLQVLRKLAVLFAATHTMKTGYSARSVKDGHMKIVPN
jgi:hypothetical protein